VNEHSVSLEVDIPDAYEGTMLRLDPMLRSRRRVIVPAREAPGIQIGCKSLLFGGTTSDDVGVVAVTWTNDRGGSGTADGTTIWTVTVALQAGINTISMFARDAVGNRSTAVLIVTI
jgi:hypothetical protein